MISIILLSLILFTSCANNKEKEIGFETLYNGFITVNETKENLPPAKLFIFTSMEQLDDFHKKYLPNHFEQLYSVMTMNNSIDFNKEYIKT